jgi:hypothetical protein
MVEPPPPLLMAVGIVTVGMGVETHVVHAIHIVWRAGTPLKATTCIEVRSMHDSDLVRPVSFELSPALNQAKEHLSFGATECNFSVYIALSI